MTTGTTFEITELAYTSGKRWSVLRRENDNPMNGDHHWLSPEAAMRARSVYLDLPDLHGASEERVKEAFRLRFGMDMFPEGETEELRSRLAMFEADIATLNMVLNEEADSNNLCDSYEQALDRVNGLVKTFTLAGRTKERRVTFTVKVPEGFSWTMLERHIDDFLTEQNLDACDGFESYDY